MGSLKPVVFVVDDENIIAQTVALILNQSGFTAYPFNDPIEALASAESGSVPNLLITDVMMPQMSGIELAIRFRQSYPQTKVLLFSGQSATTALLEEARSQGYEFEILSKPIHPTDLLVKIRTLPQAVDENPVQIDEIVRSRN